MILCLCEGASDRELRRVVREGCRNVRELVERTGAGSHCGSCACDLKRLVAEHEHDAEEPEMETLTAK